MDPQIRLLLEIVYEATEDGWFWLQVRYALFADWGHSWHTPGEAGWFEYIRLLGMLWYRLPEFTITGSRDDAYITRHQQLDNHAS